MADATRNMAASRRKVKYINSSIVPFVDCVAQTARTLVPACSLPPVLEMMMMMSSSVAN